MQFSVMIPFLYQPSALQAILAGNISTGRALLYLAWPPAQPVIMEVISPNLARQNVHAVQATGQLLRGDLFTSLIVKVTNVNGVTQLSCSGSIQSHMTPLCHNNISSSMASLVTNITMWSHMCHVGNWKKWESLGVFLVMHKNFWSWRFFNRFCYF